MFGPGWRDLRLQDHSCRFLVHSRSGLSPWRGWRLEEDGENGDSFLEGPEVGPGLGWAGLGSSQVIETSQPASRHSTALACQGSFTQDVRDRLVPPRDYHHLGAKMSAQTAAQAAPGKKQQGNKASTHPLSALCPVALRIPPSRPWASLNADPTLINGRPPEHILRLQEYAAANSPENWRH